ncbi:MAG: ABC transporter substrate-binding protein [Gammaproteobacteria bacterium]|nr:ABC transporter substrate-binding protein [Gammaproteobacteria bacterium]
MIARSLLIVFIYIFSTQHAITEEIAPTHLRLYLKWSHQFQFAGYYAAIEKGYYRDEGLELELVEKQTDLNYEDALLERDFDFAIMDSSVLLSKHIGDDIKIIAAIFQHSPLVLMSLKSSGIRNIHNLAGKRIMFSHEENSIIPAMLEHSGIKADMYTHLPHSYDYDDLLEGNTDAMAAYITTQPYMMESKDISYYIIDPASYGFDAYGDMLISTHAELEQNTERAEAFLRASIKGWKYALENSDEIIDLIIRKYRPELDKGLLQYQARMIRLAMAPDIVPVGTVETERLQAIANFYSEAGMLDRTLDTSAAYYSFDSNSSWLVIIYYLFAAILLFITSALLISRYRQSVRQRKLENTIREASRLFETAFNKSPLMLAITRVPSCEIVLANDSMSTTLGYTKDELIGKTTPDINLTNETIKAEGLVELERCGQYSTRLTFTTKDGKQRHGKLSANLLTYHDYQAAFLIIEDITDQVTKEKETRKLQTQLQQTQKMESIGQLTGGIAHDFNNILTSILGFAELSRKLYTDQLPQRMSTYLDEIIKSGIRAKDIVEQLLTFSRGSSETEHNLEPGPVIEDACKLIQASLPSTIHFSTDLTNENISICTTESQLHQLILNLVLNARASLNDKGQIDIKLYAYETDNTLCASCHVPIEGRYAVIEVCDDGPGIEASVLPRIFEPFFTTRDFGKGTGMGLPIVHGIMHGIGGHILVNQSSRDGTCFRLLFPYTSQPPSQVEEPKTDYRPTTNRRILVVDDEPTITELLTEILSIHQMQTETYNDPILALEQFSRDPDAYSLILTDQTMPGMTGTELAARVKSIRRDIPIILATGYSNLITEGNLKEFEIDRLLSKPLDRQRLLSTIKELVARN